MSRVLMDLVAELNRGTLKVVDLTQPLGPDTPVIGLPAIFAASPGVTIDVISQYDPRGPAWYSKMLAYDRDVLGVGVETIGTDAGQAGTFDPPFPNHTIMHGAGKFGLASLCNLDQLPPTGAIVIAAPLKIVHGSGSPVRVIAVAPA